MGSSVCSSRDVWNKGLTVFGIDPDSIPDGLDKKTVSPVNRITRITDHLQP
jgi:hypothetical protein